MRKAQIGIMVIYFLMGATSCTTRYYIVRHAEKACDDCLTCALQVPQGSERAITLRDSLLNKGIDNLFASECLRTQLTAEPLANALQKTTSIYQTGQLTSFIQTLKGFNDNRSILIVGHSNQLPVIIDSLAHRQIGLIGAEDFDNMYIITKKRFPATSISFQSKTYGAPTPGL